MSQVIEVVERYILPDFPDIDLPEDDGIPLETNWHRVQINLLIDLVKYRWRDRQDFFAGGNMFIYYSVEQARNRDYKGPDVFVVKDIDGSYPRQKWVTWEEAGRYPDVIFELLSPSTAQDDLGSKKQLYERTFHTPDYFCYDPDRTHLQGWRLKDKQYVELSPNDDGHLWSAELDAWLGTWEGTYQQQQAIWLRLFDQDGNLIPTEAEAEGIARTEAEAHVEAERQRADSERQRADDLEARLAALEEEMRRLRGDP